MQFKVAPIYEKQNTHVGKNNQLTARLIGYCFMLLMFCNTSVGSAGLALQIQVSDKGGIVAI